MRIGVIISRIRQEEKLLLQAFAAQGIEVETLLDSELIFDPLQIDPRWQTFDLVLERSLSVSRSMYTLAMLTAWGIPVLNSLETVRICSDKNLTALALAQANIAQPPARMAFTPDASLQAIEQLGYPSVLKPAVGSWGRMISRINDRHAAEAVLEHRYTLGSYPHHISFIQGYVEKPHARDIRAFVLGEEVLCAIYRTSPHWITNTARGGEASNCPVTPELTDICHSTAQAVGNGILAIDLFETEDGFLVNEVNHSMEFRNSSNPTGVDIPARMVEYIRATAEAQSAHSESI
jgi:[lysine-biosynthesis-protein LysW]---L-2-aminoadipate ligase